MGMVRERDIELGEVYVRGGVTRVIPYRFIYRDRAGQIIKQIEGHINFGVAVTIEQIEATMREYYDSLDPTLHPEMFPSAIKKKSKELRGRKIK